MKKSEIIKIAFEKGQLAYGNGQEYALQLCEQLHEGVERETNVVFGDLADIIFWVGYELACNDEYRFNN
jgi:hypothetical protein